MFYKTLMFFMDQAISFVTLLFKLIQIKGIQSTESTTDSMVNTPATCPISSRNLQVTSEVFVYS